MAYTVPKLKDFAPAALDKAVEKLGAVPTLNDVLLPAMKEVGDKSVRRVLTPNQRETEWK